MEQCLADIAAPAGNTADTQGAHQVAEHQKRLPAAKTADLVQIQLVGIHVDDRGHQEQNQLEHGMVDHVQEGSPGSQDVFFPQQHQHTDTHQNKTDLGNRGAGKGPLEVYGEQCQQRAQEHGDHTNDQNKSAPQFIVNKHVAANDQNAENTGLGQDAGQERTGGSGSHRMGFGQPDVNGERTCLGRETHKHTQGSGPEIFAGACGSQIRNIQSAHFLIQQENAHQQHHAANDSHSKIGTARPEGACLFVLGYPHIGAQGHDLKENKGGIQIAGQKNGNGGTQGYQLEQVIPVPVAVVGKVLRGDQSRDQPHKGGNGRVDTPEAACCESQAETADAGDLHQLFSRLTAKHQQQTQA